MTQPEGTGVWCRGKSGSCVAVVPSPTPPRYGDRRYEASLLAVLRGRSSYGGQWEREGRS